jgi:phospholipid-transporting ATPase
LTKTSHLKYEEDLKQFSAIVECEPPNQNLHEFVGNLKLSTEKLAIPLGPDQILLRGSMLRNTKWIHGLVIYSGQETKIMKVNMRYSYVRFSLLNN